MSTPPDQLRPPLTRNEHAPEVKAAPKGRTAPGAGADANDESEQRTAPGAAADANDDLRCTLCGLKACWTS